jgi:CheY-like chemotaxis protein/nitrogen-specific signal transduction histidine kinase
LQVFILTVFGTTERIRRQMAEKAELLRSTLVAEQANAAKSNFLANMSHELRTPMNAILGFIHLCQKTQLTPRQAFFLERACSASDTLLALINQTLDYAKIEAGRLEISRVQFSLAAVLHKIHTLFFLQARAKGIEFSLELPGPVPATVSGDDLRLEQILINLCANAVKFTDAGQVTLHCAVSATDAEHWQLQIEVRDTGIGIDAGQVQSLFEPFRQADDSTTRRFGGTGLGLAISRELVTLLGGTISVSSTPGRGSCFRVEIPLQRVGTEMVEAATVLAGLVLLPPEEAPAAAPALANADGEAAAGGGPLHGARILLVEDVAFNRLIASAILEDSGATIIEAGDGAEALQQLARAPDIDLVLMDLQMPVLDGYATTRAIRAQPAFAALPIIAMTANAMSSDIDACRAAGMNDHLAKPLRAETMLRCIGRHWQRRPAG